MITELTDVKPQIMQCFLEEIAQELHLNKAQVDELQQIMYRRNMKFYFYKDGDGETQVGHE